MDEYKDGNVFLIILRIRGEVIAGKWLHKNTPFFIKLGMVF